MVNRHTLTTPVHFHEAVSNTVMYHNDLVSDCTAYVIYCSLSVFGFCVTISDVFYYA